MAKKTTTSEPSYEVHPAAEAFPFMDQEEFKALKADIKANGVRSPILVSGSTIIDGRNRMAACEDLGIKCPTEEYKGNDPVGLVISQNILRRHLTDEQRVALVAKLRSGEFETEAKQSQGAARKGMTGAGKGSVAERIAKEAKVSIGKGKAASQVAKHSKEDLDDVIAGKAKLSAAAKKASAKKVASGKVRKAAPKKERSLQERVEIKLTKFMESFTVQEYSEVRKIVVTILKQAESKGQGTVAKSNGNGNGK